MKRIIESIPVPKQGENNNRWNGRTEPPSHYAYDGGAERFWKGPTIENVVKGMNDTLGEIPDEQYEVRE